MIKTGTDRLSFFCPRFDVLAFPAIRLALAVLRQEVFFLPFEEVLEVVPLLGRNFRPEGSNEVIRFAFVEPLTAE